MRQLVLFIFLLSLLVLPSVYSVANWTGSSYPYPTSFPNDASTSTVWGNNYWGITGSNARGEAT
jgi:hypothetical protein